MPPRPTRILLIAANPPGTPRLTIDEEARAIIEVVHRSEHARSLVLLQEWAVRPGDLQERFLRHQPDIVHFSCHGLGGGRLALAGEDGAVAPVTPAALAGLFAACPGIRCAMLSTCDSLELGEALRAHVPVIVATRGQLPDAAAVQFATGFYGGVVRGQPVGRCLKLGLNQVELSGLTSAAVPQLLFSGSAGPGTVIFPPDPPPPDPAPARDLPVVPPIPPPSRTFTGREAELARLTEVLAPAARQAGAAAIAVVGLGGLGKTALVLQFAEREAGRFPGGILWADAGSGHDAGERGAALNPLEVLRSLLLQWEADLGETGPPERPLPALKGRVAGLLATRLRHAGPTLLVADNVDEAAVLKGVLDAAGGCSVLVTAREAALPDELQLPKVVLGGLAPADSQALLERLAGPRARSESAARLLEHVEHHPLAVKLAGGLLAKHPDLGAAELLPKLGASRTDSSWPAAVSPGHIPKTLVECFELSVDRTPRRARALLVSLASHSPLGWSAEAARGVAGILGRAKGERLLEELVERGLVQRIDGDRYRIHRLLRDYLRARFARGAPGIFPAGWELTSLAPLLQLIGSPFVPGVSTYDLRHDHHFLRWALDHRGDPAGLGLERDAMLLGIRRRSESGATHALRSRVRTMRRFLDGADLSGLDLRAAVFDDARLEGARLSGSNLGGSAPVFLPAGRDLLRSAISRVLPATLAAALYLLAGVGAMSASKSASILRTNPVLLLVSCVGVALLSSILVGAMEAALGAFLNHGRWHDVLPVWIAWPLEGLGRVGMSVLVLVLGLWATIGSDVPGLQGWLEERSRSAQLAADLAGPPVPLEIGLVAVGPLLLTVPCLVGIVLPLVDGLLSAADAVLVQLVHRFGIGGLGYRLSPTWLVLGALVPALAIMALAGGMGAAEVLGFGQLLFVLVSMIAGFFAITGLLRSPEGGSALYPPRRTLLRRAHLRGADLQRARLAWARLGQADLSSADLRNADLSHADLRRANLAGADLRGATLVGTQLAGAGLTGAVLAGVDLSEARLDGADIGAALLDSTTKLPEGPPLRTGAAVPTGS